MKLSSRLLQIYQELQPGMPVSDLCCDHGYLGLHAYESEQFPEIIFVDQVPFAMDLLEKNFDQYVKNDENATQVKFITSDAGKVQTILTGNVVIAGVGGMNMMQMLEGLHQNQKLKPNRLILSPHRNQELYEKPELFGLKFSHVKTIEEAGKSYPIFVFLG
jgi:tRNA (adenine22-N1)-methyltransferase